MLPPAEVRRHVALLVGAGLAAASERRPAGELELTVAASLAAERAAQGVSVGALLAGLHAGHLVVWAHARATAQMLGVEPDVVLDAMQEHAEWSESVRQATITSHRTTEVGLAASGADRTTALVTALVHGGPTAESPVALRGLGLTTGRLQLVLGAAAELDYGGSTCAGVVSARVGARTVWLASDLDAAQREVLRAGVETVAVVGPFDLEAVATSFRLAERVLACAFRTGTVGRVQVEDVALDLALIDFPDVGRSLAAGLLAGLVGGRTQEQILLETLVCWLEHGRDNAATASAMFVHPNTVRHRLGRLRECGVPIDASPGIRADTRLWWAAQTRLGDV